MTEENFLHDIVNVLSIVHGKLSLIERNQEKYPKEKIVEFVSQGVVELDRIFKLVEQRKLDKNSV